MKHQVIQKLQTAIRHRSTRWKSSKVPESAAAANNSLIRLPPHILKLILGLLPLPSQACLILTCHELYQLHKPIIQDPRLRLPQRSASDNSTATISRNQQSIVAPRTILLGQIQNHKWAFCETCLKLHFRTKMKKDGHAGHLCATKPEVVKTYPPSRDKFRLIQEALRHKKNKAKYHRRRLDNSTQQQAKNKDRVHLRIGLYTREPSRPPHSRPRRRSTWDFAWMGLVNPAFMLWQ
ncbi:uncharacterized protein BO97DRAFT_421882 [Aspergillus homomorphus CBS 101889]|uniref:F-box domain-containing protein n=1 Tax=Aspergillus homomorphus (strain CBS 101889) TaxID=1450537 RepID=A0A395I4S5_ASPHC|nr:hypothetical protein BO97DRAFT_421882 [Aspergillus homomorphus CBS 101889]RAL15090.1 hypothetical protein BO97DRAFT_421882 [Aspergillus homomorphus CBS 101889]